MPHHPLGAQLRQIVSTAATSVERGQTVEQVLEESRGRQTRRSFLRGLALGVGATAALPGRLAVAGAAPAPVRVVVVGAGLAGLTCAYRLAQAGVDAVVHEANTRLGGRCWTIRDVFAEGQLAEHGGELIDQGHTRIRHLAQELRLPLDNLLQAEPSGTEAFYDFDGEPYTYAEATDDVKKIWQKLHRDLSEASYPTLFDQYTARGLELDAMSIHDWIRESVPGGLSSRLGRLLDVAYNIEYGAECDRQSALNLLYLLGYSGQGQLRMFGPSNEKYHVRGGNDQIPAALAQALAPRITTGSALVAVQLNPDGSYRLTFDQAGRSTEVLADEVVFALPFSILNQAVDLRRAGFGPLKRLAIRELAMGSNSKLNVQFASRPWRDLGNTGETASDRGCQVTWEVTRGQPGAAGILVNYTGGDYADTFARGTPARLTSRFLGQIEPVLPGLSATWNGRATVDAWTANPFTRGSYSFWQVGQYTRFAGIEGRPEGRAHFCGEHTSVDNQGYLEGAVETGERAAEEVLTNLGF